MYSSSVCASACRSPSKITLPSRKIKKLRGTSQCWPGGSGYHAVGLLIELMRGHGEGILQAVRDQQGAGLVYIALLHDQFDDGVGSYRIKAAGGRIIEQQFGLGNQRTRDGHAPPHAAGKFRGVEIERVFQFYEAQYLAHTAVDIFVVDAVLFG